MGNHIALADPDWHLFRHADCVTFQHTHRFGDTDRVSDANHLPIADCLAYTRPNRNGWTKHR